jgi:hypothetical protein
MYSHWTEVFSMSEIQLQNSADEADFEEIRRSWKTPAYKRSNRETTTLTHCKPIRLAQCTCIKTATVEEMSLMLIT